MAKAEARTSPLAYVSSVTQKSFPTAGILTLTDGGERNGNATKGTEKEEEGYVCCCVIHSLRRVGDRNSWTTS